MPAALPVASPPALAGWLLEGDPLVVALDDGAGLELVDDRGARLGRLAGEAAAALRARLDGAAPPGPPPPLLARLAALAPPLGAALAAPARRLAPAPLLAGARWRQLFVELTATCNERCAHCYAEAGPERRDALDRPTAEAVVREGAALGFEVVQLTGGEALLVPFLADLAALARALGVPAVEVYTNGLLLTAERYAPLRAAGVGFAFSLYGRDPAVHDRVTGVAGSHRRTLEAVRRALDGGSPVRVGVVATRPEDEAEAVAAVDLARALGVPPADVGLDVSRAVGRGAFAGREAPALDGLAGAGHGPEAGPAPGGGGKAAVLPDGWVVPCIFSRTLRLGRVGPEGGLAAALRGPAARLAALDAPSLAARLAAGRGAQTCAECRVTTALLEAGAPAAGAPASEAPGGGGAA